MVRRAWGRSVLVALCAGVAGVAGAAPPDEVSVEAAVPEPPEDAAAAPTQEAPRAERPADEAASGEGEGGEAEEPLQGRFVVVPRGTLVVIAAWSTQRLVPGQYVLFVTPPALAGDQWSLSAANTTLGIAVGGVSYRGWELKGALDVTLKSPSPLSRSVLAPLFYDIHIALEKPDVYFLAGQFPDLVLPFVPVSANGFPGAYVPGLLGFYRPQLRGGARWHVAPDVDVSVEAALARDVQNYEVSDVVVGGGAGVPDAQVRLALGVGPERTPSIRRWNRPFELGIGGLIGSRAFALSSGDGLIVDERETWAITASLQVLLPTGTLLRGQVWRGQGLGDYAAGVLQTVSDQLTPIRATGFWVGLTQLLQVQWRLGAGYGRDDPDDRDLDPGQRALNESAYLNLFWLWSRAVSFGLQASWWRTDWKDLGIRTSWRGTALTAVGF